MDVRDRVLDEVTNVPTTDTGYGDLLARADLTSLRRIPWEENIPFFMLDFLSPLDNQPVAMCPRSLLKRMIHELTVMGFQPMCGMELEFFNFKETSQSLKEKHYQQLTTVTPNSSCYSMVLPTEQHDYYYALLNQCHQFGIPLECLHTECGPGVYEAAIEYAPALEAADRAQLFKMAAKQIALQHGIIASFMAKPFYGLAGCSGHIHLSLVDRTNGKNVFATQNSMEVDTDTTVSARGMSDVMQAFVAGLIQGLPSIMAMLAPNINR
jgi:glutamine synthetase